MIINQWVDHIYSHIKHVCLVWSSCWFSWYNWKFIKWSLETFFNHNEIKNIFMDEYKKAVKIVISDLQSASNKKIFLSASLHKNHKKTLKIGTSGIRIWGIGIRLPKWSEYIRISDNSDIRTSTLTKTIHSLSIFFKSSTTYHF